MITDHTLTVCDFSCRIWLKDDKPHGDGMFMLSWHILFVGGSYEIMLNWWDSLFEYEECVCEWLSDEEASEVCVIHM